LTHLDEVCDRLRAPATWLWEGYLAAGNVTLLTSQWKTGKTTLVSVLLAKMGSGGTLAGLPVRPGRVVVVSEESQALWAMRHRRLPIGAHCGLMCRPFPGGPTPERWSALIDHLDGVRQTKGLDLVVIDPLAGLLPLATENSAACMLAALDPLRRLTAAGVSVLVNHHPRKGESAAGQAARGSGALAGHVDIVIEMTWFGSPVSDDRRRRLTAFSRHAETPRRLVVEWTDDGSDYRGLGDFPEPEHADGWGVVLGVLMGAGGRLTRPAIRQNWPPGVPVPSDVTLYRWLDRGVADGLVVRAGTGRKNDPFTYELPGRDGTSRPGGSPTLSSD
jgi:hypothetical protein